MSVTQAGLQTKLTIQSKMSSHPCLQLGAACSLSDSQAAWLTLVRSWQRVSSFTLCVLPLVSTGNLSSQIPVSMKDRKKKIPNPFVLLS